MKLPEMTEQEFISLQAEGAKASLESLQATSDIKLQTLFDLAIESLDKQIQKEPIYENVADRGCPSCGEYIPFDARTDIQNAPNHCPSCGQALRWTR